MGCASTWMGARVWPCHLKPARAAAAESAAAALHCTALAHAVQPRDSPACPSPFCSARVFNAIVASGYDVGAASPHAAAPSSLAAAAAAPGDSAAGPSSYGPRDLGALFDSISICLSKGLGAPVGSLLLGEALCAMWAQPLAAAPARDRQPALHMTGRCAHLHCTCLTMHCTVPQARAPLLHRRCACASGGAGACGRRAFWQQLECTRCKTTSPGAHVVAWAMRPAAAKQA